MNRKDIIIATPKVLSIAEGKQRLRNQVQCSLIEPENIPSKQRHSSFDVTDVPLRSLSLAVHSIYVRLQCCRIGTTISVHIWLRLIPRHWGVRYPRCDRMFDPICLEIHKSGLVTIIRAHFEAIFRQIRPESIWFILDSCRYSANQSIMIHSTNQTVWITLSIRRNPHVKHEDTNKSTKNTNTRYISADSLLLDAQ